MNATTVRQVQIINPTIGLEADKAQRIAAYCRVSTDSEDQANSFLAQIKYYNDYISSQDNMVLADIYADEGITGTCMEKRDDFKRLIKDCSLGRIDRVLVKSVSRFARNSLECLEVIRQLKDYGVSVLFENDNIDTKTMNSEMILYVKSAFAQSEALAGSKRVSTAYRMKMENGNFLTYHAPFGYRLIEHKLVIEASEAETVRRIFNMYLSGMGVNAIAHILNKEGVKGKEHWTAVMLRYALSNEKYVGDSLLQKTYTPQVFPLRNIPNRGELDKYYALTGDEHILDASSIENQIREYQDQIDMLMEKEDTTGGDPERYEKEIVKIYGKIEILRQQLKLAKEQAQTNTEVNLELERFSKLFNEYEGSSFTEFDDVTVRRLVECIQVMPDKRIVVTLKGGMQGEEKLD